MQQVCVHAYINPYLLLAEPRGISPGCMQLQTDTLILFNYIYLFTVTIVQV